MKIAADGEILVRGENVTTGYFNAADETAQAFEDGWFHTGDIGEIGQDGQLFIRGRKKEMIVTPEGLNVFPEDVERVLNHMPGVRDSAVVGVTTGGQERVHAALVLEPGIDRTRWSRCERAAGRSSEDPTRRRVAGARAAANRRDPEVEARGDSRSGCATRRAAARGAGGTDKLTELSPSTQAATNLSTATTIDELGLSSLERVELMVALEDAFQTQINEGAFSGARDVGQLRALVEGAATGEIGRRSSRSTSRRGIGRCRLAPSAARACPTWLLPLARVFAWTARRGARASRAIDGPVIFAANHQSHMDTPVILAALPPRFRYRLAARWRRSFSSRISFPSSTGARRGSPTASTTIWRR